MGRPIAAFHDFVGQRRAVGHVRRLIQGAKQVGDPCVSMLLMGPAGTGKSSMAAAIAKEYGTKLHVILAGNDTKPRDLCVVLQSVRFGDVLLIDEVHSLTTDAQQLLYVALDQCKIPTLAERGIDRSTFESIAQFTLIVATNEPGHLKQALRSRLTQIQFDPYSPKELKAIAQRIVDSRGLDISPQAASLLAATAQGSPRCIGRRIDGLRHYWPDVQMYAVDHVRGLLDGEGIDERGLTSQQRQYLLCLASSPKAQDNVERLAVRLGCDTANVRREIEPYLIEQGLVGPASKMGRGLTMKGQEVVQQFSQQADAEDSTNDSENIANNSTNNSTEDITNDDSTCR